MRIIITDPDSRKSFDVFNILRKQFLDVEILIMGEYSPLLSLIYPEVQFVDLLSIKSSKEKLKDYENCILLPIEEKSILKIHELEKHLKEIKFLIPDKFVFDITRNKKKFSNWCANNGIKIPREINQLQPLIEDAIEKPIIGSGSRGIKRFQTGDYVTQRDNTIIQEIITSKKKIEGFFALCKEGEVINWYTHQRLKTWPKNGGVSIFARSSKNLRLLQEAQPLLKKLNFNGLVMIEFLFDEKNEEYKVIEVNPRTWGSILLSHKSGVPIIANYIYLLSNKSLVQERFKETYIHWIFPYEILNFLTGSISIKRCNLKFNERAFINISNSSLFRSLLFQCFFLFNRIFKK